MDGQIGCDSARLTRCEKVMYTGYYITQDGHICGRRGYTRHYFSDDHIYGPNGYTRFYRSDDSIYGPSGYTRCYFSGEHIYGPSDALPWHTE